VKAAFEALIKFLADYRLDSVIGKRELQDSLKIVYRRYHALLVFNGYLLAKRPAHFKRDTTYKWFMLYFREMVSDICQAIFLSSHGLYKPTYLVLRSGVENFIRCLLIYEKSSVPGTTSIFQLIATAKKSAIANQTAITAAHFSQIEGLYKRLCMYVHTSDEHHMDLTTAVGVYPRYDRKLGQSASKEIIIATRNVAALLSYMFLNELRRFHHEDFDAVLDCFSAQTKRDLMKI
jgi:hypothetical protein